VGQWCGVGWMYCLVSSGCLYRTLSLSTCLSVFLSVLFLSTNLILHCLTSIILHYSTLPHPTQFAPQHFYCYCYWDEAFLPTMCAALCCGGTRYARQYCCAGFWVPSFSLCFHLSLPLSTTLSFNLIKAEEEKKRRKKIIK
jgi:hypothetical protein